jgi:hypothetical protein
MEKEKLTQLIVTVHLIIKGLNNLSLITANKLLSIAPMFHQYFVESSPGGKFYNYKSIKKDD